ncbi:hypothetical protein [Streptomyces sp. NPDC001985]|uniref:hypothetical protein n=1 Tax=Streptomyces sp. NPDC001985 TaxID=3154406 RepID=UPI00333067B9
MTRNLSPARAAARERVIESRADVVARYTGGESIASIARVYNVGDVWLKDRLTEWRTPLRTKTESVHAAWAWERARKADQVSTFRRPAD